MYAVHVTGSFSWVLLFILAVIIQSFIQNTSDTVESFICIDEYLIHILKIDSVSYQVSYHPLEHRDVIGSEVL